MPGIDPTPMLTASEGVRSHIVDVCRRDLSTDIADVSGCALRCIDFMRLWTEFPADIIEELRMEADTLTSSGLAKAHELGARFVVVPPPNSDTPIAIDNPMLCVDQFETIVPQTKWSITELPTESQVAIIVGDASLRNRTVVAGAAMRQRLTAASS